MARDTSIRLAAASCALLVMLAGCTGYKKATKQNFTRALNAYYSNHDDCLYPDALHFPYEVPMKDKTSDTPRGLDALMGAGLVTRQQDWAIGVERYSLTSYGSRVTPRFCYGHRVITSIDDFPPPSNADGSKTVEVEYHYTMRDVPGWAKSSQMQHAFRALTKSTTGEPKDKAKLELTLNGWVVEP